MFIEPKDSRKPTGCDAARPSAQTICCSLRSISLPIAAADAEHAGRAGDVPADVVMVGIDGVADPAFGLDAEHQRVEELLAGNRLHSDSAIIAEATGPAG